jgi:hypothetical protein
MILIKLLPALQKDDLTHCGAYAGRFEGRGRGLTGNAESGVRKRMLRNARAHIQFGEHCIRMADLSSTSLAKMTCLSN